MKLKGHAYFLFAILALSTLLVVLALTMPFFSSKFLPVLIGGLVMILAVVELVKELRSVKASDNGARGGAAGTSFHGFLLAALWFGGYLAGVFLIGFVIATALFILLFLKIAGARWLPSIAYSVLTTGAIWLIFQYLMKATLYQGIIIRMLS